MDFLIDLLIDLFELVLEFLLGFINLFRYIFSKEYRDKRNSKWKNKLEKVYTMIGWFLSATIICFITLSIIMIVF